MTNYCLKCNSAVTPSTPSVKSSTCKKYCHMKCCDLVAADVAANITCICKICSGSLSSSDRSLSFSAIEQIFEQLSKLKTDLKLELAKMIDDKFQQTNDRISVMESNIQKLQIEVNHINGALPKTEISTNVNEVVNEINDRVERSKNVLIFNVPESTERMAEDRVKSDLNHISSILDPLGSFPQPRKILRLGSPKPNATRPLNLIFENNEEAQSVLRSNKVNPNKLRQFRPDLTKLQRESNTAVFKEFNDRKSKGEDNIALSFKNNNVAQITAKKGTAKQSKN